jgi:hypothetical protein
MLIANCSCVSKIVLSAKHCAVIRHAFLPFLLNAALFTVTGRLLPQGLVLDAGDDVGVCDKGFCRKLCFLTDLC